jgi:hypothetical protein
MKKLLALPCVLVSLIACGPQPTEPLSAEQSAPGTSEAEMRKFSSYISCGITAPGTYGGYVVTGYAHVSNDCYSDGGMLTGFKSIDSLDDTFQVCGTQCPDFSQPYHYDKVTNCNPDLSTPTVDNAVYCSRI